MPSPKHNSVHTTHIITLQLMHTSYYSIWLSFYNGDSVHETLNTKCCTPNVGPTSHITQTFIQFNSVFAMVFSLKNTHVATRNELRNLCRSQFEMK